MIRIAESWDHLPPHIREAIQTLIDAVSPIERAQPSRSNAPEMANEAAWRMARECRNIVQSCLREEEWRDADQEFFEVISKGLQGCNL